MSCRNATLSPNLQQKTYALLAKIRVQPTVTSHRKATTRDASELAALYREELCSPLPLGRFKDGQTVEGFFVSQGGALPFNLPS